MRVLLVGGGAREHSILKAAARTDKDVVFYAVMKNKNPGIARMCRDYLLANETDVDKVVDYAERNNIDMALIGPEAPLGAGIVDALERSEISAIGPTQYAAQLEISKRFMRNLMEKYNIQGLVKYGAFEDLKTAKRFIESLDGEVAVKPIGLTGGKGVKIVGEHLRDAKEALEYAKRVIEDKIGGAPCVLIEEKMVGEEFTLQAFCDGKVAVPMPAVQDHKRAYEGDVGPNTGGMGSYSQADGLLPFLSSDDFENAVLTCQKIVEAMRREGHEYKGTLYGQFMLTPYGIKIIECNARFGDPEAMNVLPLLEADYLDICESIIDGTLAKKNINFAKKATVCKYVVPRGYGEKPIAGAEIIIDENGIAKTGAELFYASVNEEGGKVYTTTSRALALVGIANTIEKAEKIAERSLEFVKGEDIYVRHDIGKRESIERKVRRLHELLGDCKK